MGKGTLLYGKLPRVDLELDLTRIISGRWFLSIEPFVDHDYQSYRRLSNLCPSLQSSARRLNGPKVGSCNVH